MAQQASQMQAANMLMQQRKQELARENAVRAIGAAHNIESPEYIKALAPVDAELALKALNYQRQAQGELRRTRLAEIQSDEKLMDLASKHGEEFKNGVRMIEGFPEQERPAAWSRLVSALPEKMRSVFPPAYSPDAARLAMSTTSEILSAAKPKESQYLMGPAGPIAIDKNTGTYSVVPEGGAAPAAPAAAAPAAAPVAAAPAAAAPAAAAPAAAPAAAAPAAAPVDLASSMLRRFEGFRERPYYDVNAYRTGYGSDTITQPDGTVVQVQPGMQITREDAERDLSRRLNTEFIPRASSQVGAENWTALPAPAQAALASVTYNYGSLPKTVVAAVKTGDVNAIADAVQALKDNPGRRAQEAAVIRGEGLIQSSPTVPSMTMGQQFAIPGSVPGGLNALASLAGISAAGQANNLPLSLNTTGVAAPAAVAPAQPPLTGMARERATIAQEKLAEKGAEERQKIQINKEASDAEKVVIREGFDKVWDNMIAKFQQLGRDGMLIVPGETSLANRAKAIGSTLSPKLTTLVAPERAAPVTTLSNLRQTMLSALMGATGLSSKQLDSNNEMRAYLDSLSDPGQPVESIVDTFNNLSERFGTGKKISVKDLTGGKAQNPVSGKAAPVTNIHDAADAILRGGTK